MHLTRFAPGAALLLLFASVRAEFPTIALQPVSVQEIHAPTTIQHAGDGSGRIFVCDQPGIIYIIEHGALLPTPFLDITSVAIAQTTGYSERGLLGLAFHPDFENPGSPGYRKFYVNYSKPYVAGVDPDPPVADHTPNHVTVISEFTVSAGDPNIADAGSERRLLIFTQPQSNHNGGQLEFGPDGMLYIGTGDGGSSNDNNVGHTGGSASRPSNGLGNSQDRTNFLGKILRIDPIDPDGAGAATYSIPADNPFFNDPTPGLKKEIYAYGLRNPWRFSFDQRAGGTNRLFCGDVGQGRIEEINIITAGGNYGWRYLEGDEMPTFSSGSATNPMPHPGGTLIDPIAMYAHPGVTTNPPLPQLGLSVTGGFVYRGAAIPAMRGKYLFGDYGSTGGASDGRIMGLEETAPGSGIFTLTQAVPLHELANPVVGQRILTLGEDESGEIYIGMKTNAGVLALDNGLPAGGIYKVVPVYRYSNPLTSSRDNTIFSEDPVLARDFSDGAGYIYTGRTSVNFGPYNRRGLVSFNIAGHLPANALIQSATLVLNATKVAANAPGLELNLHRISETWGEGTSVNPTGGFGAPATPNDATWAHRFYPATNWSTPGGVFSPTSSGLSVIGDVGPMTWPSTPQMVTDVQGWLDNPVNNAGWVILSDEATEQSAVQFDSRETGGIPPTLHIVFDTTTPLVRLTVPDDIVAEAEGPGGAGVVFVVSAIDENSNPLTPVVDPPSGSVFPIGTTVVTASASDFFGNTQTTTFTVTVSDTTPPLLTVPDPITAEATSPGGAVVNFTPTATDEVSTPVIVSTPASGSTFPLGVTTVNVTATDAAGNSTPGSFTVTVQDTTKPALMLPAPVTAEATSASGAMVNFSVTATDAVSTPNVIATPVSGSTFPLGTTTVNVTATDAAGNMEMGSFNVTVSDTTAPAISTPDPIVVEATGPAGAVATFNATATDAVSTPNVSASPVSGSTFPLGVTTVNITATDELNNTSMASFSVTVRDTTDPVIGGVFSPLATSAETIGNYTSQAVASDIVGVATVVQSPAPGNAIPLGNTTVTLTATDAAGNDASVSFILTRHPPEPESTPRHESGTPIPGAGEPGAPPTGATFVSVGVPAINDDGTLAFFGKWTSPVGTGAGIFRGSPPELLVKVGDMPPSLAPAAYHSFSDPLIDAAGNVAFLATISGLGVTKSSDTILATDAFGGQLDAVAREGATVGEPGFPKIKTIKDISLVDGEVLFTATLSGGTPAAKASTNDAAFRITDDGLGPVRVVREGDALRGSRVKAFKLLSVATGSPGQNRGHHAGTATFLALLADGTQALVDSSGGVLTDFAATGNTTGGTVLPGATFKSFGLVSADTTRAAFLATLNTGVGGVTKADARSVFMGTGNTFDPIARLTEAVPGLAGATFKGFLDPVLSPGAGSIAFPATIKGPGIKASSDSVLLHQPDGGALHIIAREGGQPPGVAAGARWLKFVSLAIPGGSTGPVFHATLVRNAGGVSAANDAGVWGVDSAGTVRLLFREGDLIDGRTLKSFTVLNAVPGSTGVTRAFNSRAQVAWRAEFTDGTSAVVVTSVP